MKVRGPFLKRIIMVVSYNELAERSKVGSRDEIILTVKLQRCSSRCI